MNKSMSENPSEGQEGPTELHTPLPPAATWSPKDGGGPPAGVPPWDTHAPSPLPVLTGRGSSPGGPQGCQRPHYSSR